MGEISLSLRSIADTDRGGPGLDADSLANDDRGSGVRVLKYGVPTRAYGVN